MRFGKEWLDEVISVNPVVIFTHHEWLDSKRAIDFLRLSGVDDVHEVKVDGHAGEVPILHSLMRHLEEKEITTCRIFVDGDSLGDGAALELLGESALAQKCRNAGATVHPSPVHTPGSPKKHSKDRLFVAARKGEP